MGHQGLPAAPCPFPTSHPPPRPAQITISISLPGLSLLHAPHELISPHPHHPLLHPLIDSTRRVHLPLRSHCQGPSPSLSILALLAAPEMSSPPQLLLQMGWKSPTPRMGMETAHAPVGGDLLRQAKVTHYSCVAVGLAAHQAVLGAQEDPCHTDHTRSASPATSTRMARHSTVPPAAQPAKHGAATWV